jgi:phage gp29-like protein
MNWRDETSKTLTQVGRRVLAIATAVSLASSPAPRPPKSASFAEEPPRASALEWNPRLIKQAERMADGGSMRLAAQLCDQILSDDRLSGGLREVRIRGRDGRPVAFEPPNDDAASPVDQLAEDWWEMAPEDTLSEWMEWGIILGIGVGRVASWERVEQPSGVRLLPHRDDGTVGFDVIHPSALRYDHEQKAWFAKQRAGAEVRVTPGDGTWIVYMPYGAKRPWARGAWRSIARWWLLKSYAVDDWGRYSERNGQGLLVGVAPPETRKEHRDELAADLQDLGRETSIALPPGYDLKLIESEANTWETFKAQVEMANTAIAIRILGQNLSTEVSGGSYAAAEVHKAVAASIIRADDETSATTLRAQLIWWWTAFNFGDGRKAPWPKRDTTPPADTAALAKTLIDAADALQKWTALGAPVDNEAYARTFRVPLVEGQKWSEPAEASPAPIVPTTQMRLASGDDPADASGAIRGQSFVDTAAAGAVQSAAAAIEPDVAALLELIDGMEDVGDWPGRLRAELAKHYENTNNPSALESLVHKATILAELAGRVAVVEDL